MAPLLEDKIKDLLGRHGLDVPKGTTISGLEEVPAAAARIGFPAVVKALVPIGKKGKAGAVRFVADEAALASAVGELVGQSVRGFPVESVLVESREPIAEELIVSFNFDAVARGPVLLMGTLGGVDVEEAVATHPDSFVRVPLDVWEQPTPADFAAHWERLGLPPEKARRAGAATAGAYEAFRRYDARILEINPLAFKADATPVAIGALMDVDDDALYRQPEIAGLVEYGAGRLGRPPTPLERRLLDLNAAEPSGSIRFRELPGGDLVCLFSGGGCSLWATDHMIDGGGKPATYFDATTPSESMWRTLFDGVLRLPGVRGLMFGSNIINLARIENRVRILIETLEQLNVDLERFPVVVRLAGPGEDEVRTMARRLPHLEYYGDEVTLEEALDRFLEKAREARARSAAE